MANRRGQVRPFPATLVVVIPVLSILSFTPGCTRTGPVHSTESSSPTSGASLPFHPPVARSASTTNPPDVPPNPGSPATLPFHVKPSPHVLPSEMLLAVQLEGSLSSAKNKAGDVFLAFLAAPLLVDNQVAMDRGTQVTGRVESTRPGYFQLTLISMSSGGKQVSLHTSSLFARGYASTQQHSSGIRVPKGQRFIFRLTAPVFVDNSAH